MERVGLVVNPYSAGRRTGARLDELRSAASAVWREVAIIPTDGPGGGAAAAAEALDKDCGLVVAVGGDGTAHEVVNGLLAADARAAFGLVPAGTGSDLARTLGQSHQWPEAMRRLASGTDRQVDVFEVRCTGHDGAPLTLHGINVVGVGVAGDVVARANQSSKRLGGTLTFALATVGASLAWTAPEVTIRWKDAGGREGQWAGALTNVFLANAQYCGGGMWVAPDAVLDDGLFDLVLVPHWPIPLQAARARHLYTGKMASVPGVITQRVQWFTASAKAGVVLPVDVDGEAPGRGPVEVSCLPGALRMRMPSR